MEKYPQSLARKKKQQPNRHTNTDLNLINAFKHVNYLTMTRVWKDHNLSRLILLFRFFFFIITILQKALAKSVVVMVVVCTLYTRMVPSCLYIELKQSLCMCNAGGWRPPVFGSASRLQFAKSEIESYTSSGHAEFKIDTTTLKNVRIKFRMLKKLPWEEKKKKTK